jgi:hypothetical protein
MMTKDTAQECIGARSAKNDSVWLMLLWLGAAIYAISFALPAVARSDDSMRGWQCAWFALSFDQGFREPLLSFALFASGLINPLTLAYLWIRMNGDGPRVRRVLGIVALSFIPLSWLVISSAGLKIEIGHVAWVVGLLLMMSPEAIGIARAPSVAE